MTIFELIQHLQSLQQQHGDLPVYIYDSYIECEGWGDDEYWSTDGVGADYYHESIDLGGSGPIHEFIGLR